MLTANEFLSASIRPEPVKLRPGPTPKDRTPEINAYIDSLPQGEWFSGNSVRRELQCAQDTAAKAINGRRDLLREWNPIKRAYGWRKA